MGYIAPLCRRLQVELKVNKMTSTKSVLTFGNYDLPFCPVRFCESVRIARCPFDLPLRFALQPPGGVRDSAENLGEHLTGDVIENSAYKVSLCAA